MTSHSKGILFLFLFWRRHGSKSLWDGDEGYYPSCIILFYDMGFIGDVIKDPVSLRISCLGVCRSC